MASGPITSWQIDGETMETETDFIFLGPKIAADDDCSHKIKRPLLSRRKAMTNLDSILKSKDITLPTKVCIVKAMLFPVVMHGCDSWTITKAELWRIDAFLNCGVGEDSLESLGLQGDQSSQSWRKSVLNIHWRTDGEAKTPMLGHLMQRTYSFEKTLMLGKIEGRRRRGQQRMRR